MSTSTHAKRRTSFCVIELVFETPSKGVPADDFRKLLTSLEGVVEVISRYAMSDAGTDMEMFEDGRLVSLRILALSMASPLQMLARVPAMSEKGIKAIGHFLGQLIFYDQEKERREAIAAEAWERTYAARIKNTREVLALMGEVGIDQEAKQHIARTLIEAATQMSDSTSLRLKHAAVSSRESK